MKRTLITLMLIAFCSVNMLWAQEKQEEKKFSTVVDVPTTEVRNQESTGTCWAFAGTSFIEAELIRLGAGNIDLSEMFTVRHAYSQKALRYFRLHGKGNFSEGGQAHDVLNVVKEFGFIPESAYSGNEYQSDFHIHREMVKSTKAMLDQIVKNPNRVITPVWEESVNGVLDTYMGKTPKTFTYEGTETTPAAYAEKLGFNTEDYIELTSYSHHPYYKEFNLEIPDNWSHDLYYNLPIDELMEVMDNALMNGYSVCWDGDVSEKGFSHRNGYAVLPASKTADMTDSEIAKWEKDVKKAEKKVSQKGKEPEVDQALRQLTFDNFETTDDHLMHLTGIVKDQKGTRYYKTKNSWSKTSNKMGGYLNMSEAYVRLKTVAIMVHKDAIPKEVKKKLGL
ncbi:C1 family peptidase [Labilibaculum sp. DW002]|uniref:Aminopeptidase n=1 Tax=Paralabilibaculum antarcticum TaxID=2912572 RepID=A0ABT5VVE1_9BACT|nr:C1 family peptidase [Labilibaculum sp. DW002]MDE5419266.1 C1 family peptidase [Labilibaculum sp. DW002]